MAGRLAIRLLLAKKKQAVAKNCIFLKMKNFKLFWCLYNFFWQLCLNMSSNFKRTQYFSGLRNEECFYASQHVFVFQLLFWKTLLNKSAVLKFPCELFHSFCSKTDRLAKGSECYQKSLSLNPFLWSPFESLCEIGESAELFYPCNALERFLWAAINLKYFVIV